MIKSGFFNVDISSYVATGSIYTESDGIYTVVVDPTE